MKKAPDSLLLLIDRFESAKLGAGPVYLRLRKILENMILAGELADGCRLPPDTEFSKLLGVNHITLGKALNELRRQGLLNRRRSYGTFVKAPAAVTNEEPGEKSKLVAVIFDNVNPQTFQSELFVALHSELLKIGKEMLFLSSSGNHAIQYEQIHGILRQPNCCGCLVWSILESAQVRELMKIKPPDFPLVFMDKYYDDAGHDAVVYDGMSGGLEIGRHFIRQGWQKFIFLIREGKLNFSSIQDRLNGLKRSIAEYNLSPEAIETIAYRQIADFDSAGLLKKLDDAVLVTAYIAEARDVATYLNKSGHKQRITSLVTFGPLVSGNSVENILECDFDINELARQAVGLLQERIGGNHYDWKIIKIKGKLYQNTALPVQEPIAVN